MTIILIISLIFVFVSIVMCTYDSWLYVIRLNQTLVHYHRLSTRFIELNLPDQSDAVLGVESPQVAKYLDKAVLFTRYCVFVASLIIFTTYLAHTNSETYILIETCVLMWASIMVYWRILKQERVGVKTACSVYTNLVETVEESNRLTEILEQKKKELENVINFKRTD